MTRQNLFSDAWDEDDAKPGLVAGSSGGRTMPGWGRRCTFAPGAPEGRMHMHFGAEEMFFVLSGRPVFRNHLRRGDDGTRGTSSSAPRGGPDCTRSATRPTPAPFLAVSAGGFPDVVAYPEHGYAWVATRDPDPELLARGGDPGIIARFEIPIE